MKLGERGQITIPKQLRDRYGLYPNVDVEFIEEHGQIILRRVTYTRQQDVWANVVGILKDAGNDNDIDINADIEEMRGR